MPSALPSFEAALDDLDVPVTIAGPAEVPTAIETAIEPPAVGVALDDRFGGAAGALAETSVEVDPTPVALRGATTGVTGARIAIADTGTVVLEPTGSGAELVSLFVDRHVAVVPGAAVVPDLAAVLDDLQTEIRRSRASAILATGPSATADMGALVRGAHGPAEVRVVVVEDQAGEDDATGDDAVGGDATGDDATGQDRIGDDAVDGGSA